jgi:hypothetical protein
MIVTKGSLARAVVKAETTADLCAVGFALILIGCAKQGDTMQESVDKYRYITGEFEKNLRDEWDELRNATVEVES